MSNLIPPSFTEEDAELREGKQLTTQGHTAGSFFMKESLFGSGGSHPWSGCRGFLETE